jgi:hypothetical protein
LNPLFSPLAEADNDHNGPAPCIRISNQGEPVMRRRALGLMVVGFCSLCGLFVPAATAQHQHRWQLDFHRNNCWPQPFQAADRELTRAPLIAMTAAGWRQNNTLSDHFFSADDQSINPAGELKLRWIATQAPPHRRVVYVLRGPTAEATEARVTNVERTMDKFYIEGQRPPVLITNIIPPGASGDYFDAVDRQLKQSIPAPRLPEMQPLTGDN